MINRFDKSRRCHIELARAVLFGILSGKNALVQEFNILKEKYQELRGAPMWEMNKELTQNTISQYK